MVKFLWLNSLNLMISFLAWDQEYVWFSLGICCLNSWKSLASWFEWYLGYHTCSHMVILEHLEFYFVHIHGWNVEQLKSLIMVGWNHDLYGLWLEYNILSDEISSWSYFHQDLSKTVVELGQEDWTWHKN